MIFRNLIFEPEVVKQRLRAGMVSHHEQQASKCNGEQQHRVLWPAYNLNIAPPQASTEGLFQQTQAFGIAGFVRPSQEKKNRPESCIITFHLCKLEADYGLTRKVTLIKE